jgi:hypothetical protein
MKKSKWLKWKIGAGSAILIFFIFQHVKESPEFEAAKQVALASTAAISKPAVPQEESLNHQASPGQKNRRNSTFEQGFQQRGQQGMVDENQPLTGNDSSSSTSPGLQSHTQSRAS